MKEFHAPILPEIQRLTTKPVEEEEIPNPLAEAEEIPKPLTESVTTKVEKDLVTDNIDEDETLKIPCHPQPHHQ